MIFAKLLEFAAVFQPVYEASEASKQFLTLSLYIYARIEVSIKQLHLLHASYGLPVKKGTAGVLFVSTPVRGKTRARGLEPSKSDFEKINEYKDF